MFAVKQYIMFVMLSVIARNPAPIQLRLTPN